MPHIIGTPMTPKESLKKTIEFLTEKMNHSNLGSVEISLSRERSLFEFEEDGHVCYDFRKDKAIFDVNISIEINLPQDNTDVQQTTTEKV